ncbi:MAG: N-acetyltransferase [Paludibacteraceae bacterium]|nr:N-acetyltransferase [Paludibacteraceae bacterium]
MTTEIRHTENGESGIFTAWQNDVQVGEMTYMRSCAKGGWNSRGEVVSAGNSERETCCADNNAIEADGASKRFATEQMVINHTQVFDGYEGQGIARQMVMAAVDFARKNNRTIVPVCSYAKAVLTRTDEYHDVL